MNTSPPLLIDLFCGRGGWTKAALRRGWRAVGYDQAAPDYPAELHTATLPLPVRTFIDQAPTLIVASPPCEEFARAEMPWLRGDHRPDQAAIDLLQWSLSLIGCGVPVVVECSLFAARYVEPQARAGPFALWGNLPALLPILTRHKTRRNGYYAAARAEIPDALAGWIIETTPRRRHTPRLDHDR